MESLYFFHKQHRMPNFLDYAALLIIASYSVSVYYMGRFTPSGSFTKHEAKERCCYYVTSVASIDVLWSLLSSKNHASAV